MTVAQTRAARRRIKRSNRGRRYVPLDKVMAVKDSKGKKRK